MRKKLVEVDGSRPVVFIGPSAPEDFAGLLPSAQFLPPVQRGQLYDCRGRGGGVFLIIDGLFAHELAVSPREVVDVLRDGAVVYGASSMGALRAAECWPAGMRGVGLIAKLFRLGRLSSDDEVAVATHPGRRFEAASVALVNVRYAVSRAVKKGLLDRARGRGLVEAASAMYFSERTWPAILHAAGPTGERSETLRTFLGSIDLKKIDARRALGRLASQLQGDPQLLSRHRRRSSRKFVEKSRYRGHDPWIGRDPEALKRELLIWLLGSGRYQPYVWPVVLHEPEFRRPPARLTPRERPEWQREALAAVLVRVCAHPESFLDAFVAELDLQEELHAEIMRWHALTSVAEHARGRGMAVDAAIEQRTREEIAIRHGVRDWKMLQDEAEDGALFGAIPLSWVEAAVKKVALARTFAVRRHSPGRSL